MILFQVSECVELLFYFMSNESMTGKCFKLIGATLFLSLAA